MDNRRASSLVRHICLVAVLSFALIGPLFGQNPRALNQASAGQVPGATRLDSPYSSWWRACPEGELEFIWLEVPEATYYYLYIREEQSQTSKFWQWYKNDEMWIKDGICYIYPDVYLTEGVYAWWVLTWNEYGYGSWSAPLNFVVSSPPGKAKLISPSGQISTQTPTYTWNAVPEASWYRLWVDDSIGKGWIKAWYSKNEVGCPSESGTCSVTPKTPVAKGRCEWRIQTCKDAGDGFSSYGPWSDPLVFNAGIPGKAKLKSPSGSISTTMPTYTWEAVSGATWYQLIVSDSANANKIKQWYKAADAGCASGTGNCSVTPETALAQGQCMWWIITYNEAGEGPQSDGMSFTVSSSTELTTNTWAGVWSCKEPRYAAMTMTIAGQGMSSQITAVYPDPATEKYTITQVDLLTASGTDEWHCPSCGNPGVWYGTWRISISGNMFYLTRWDNISSWVGYYNCTRK